MLTNEEKINLLKIEGKRLVQVYESADVKVAIPELCPVCAEAERLMLSSSIASKCKICYQLGVGKRCRQFSYLSDGFVGLARLFDPQYNRNEEIKIRKKIKELIFEVKEELDRISNEMG